MALQFPCPGCGRQLQVPEEAAGRQGKCPSCGMIFTIPSGGPLPPSGQPGSAGPSAPFGPPGPSGPPPGAPSGAGGYPPYGFAPSGPPPGVGPSAASSPAGEIRPSPFDLGDVFNRTWNIFQSQWGLCVGVAVVWWLLNFAVGFIGSFIPILGGILAWVFGTWLGCGLGLFFLKTARGQRAELGDIFTGGPFFLSMLVANLLFGLMMWGIAFVGIGLPVLVGMAIGREVVVILGLCIATVIVLVVLGLIFSQFFWGILDRNVGPIEALRLSAVITQGNRFTLFVLYLLGFFIQLLGVLACCIGVFVTTPFIFLLGAVAYLRMTGQPTAGMEVAPGYPAPPSGGSYPGYPGSPAGGSYPVYPPPTPSGGSYPGYPAPPGGPGFSAPPSPPGPR